MIWELVAVIHQSSSFSSQPLFLILPETRDRKNREAQFLLLCFQKLRRKPGSNRGKEYKTHINPDISKIYWISKENHGKNGRNQLYTKKKKIMH